MEFNLSLSTVNKQALFDQSNIAVSNVMGMRRDLQEVVKNTEEILVIVPNIQRQSTEIVKQTTEIVKQTTDISRRQLPSLAQAVTSAKEEIIDVSFEVIEETQKTVRQAAQETARTVASETSRTVRDAATRTIRETGKTIAKETKPLRDLLLETKINIGRIARALAYITPIFDAIFQWLKDREQDMRKDALEAQVRNLTILNEKMFERLRDLRDEIREMTKADLGPIQAEIQGLSTQIQAMQRALEIMQQRLEMLAQNHSQLDSRLALLEQTLAAQLAIAQQRLQDLLNVAGQTKTLVKTQTETLTKIDTATQEITKRIAEMLTKLGTATTAIQLVRALLEKANKTITETKTKTEDVHRKVIAILTKLDFLQCLSHLCQFVALPVPIVNCEKNNDGKYEPVVTYKIISVPKEFAASIREILLYSEKIAKEQCLAKNEDCCVAAVPEWWQVRPGADRPQLVIQFAVVSQDTEARNPPKYPITIPWANTPEPLQASPIGKYKKGNIMGILTLSDNSKVIVNAETQQEAERVLNQIQGIIVADKLTGHPPKIGPRGGEPVEVQEVEPRIMRFFSTGQKNTLPDWEVYID